MFKAGQVFGEMRPAREAGEGNLPQVSGLGTLLSLLSFSFLKHPCSIHEVEVVVMWSEMGWSGKEELVREGKVGWPFM